MPENDTGLGKTAQSVLQRNGAGERTSELFLGLIKEAGEDTKTTDQFPRVQTEPLGRIQAGPPAARPASGGHRRKKRRTSTMYLITVSLWALLCVPMVWSVRPSVERAFHENAALGAAVIFTAVFVALFWLNGWKDLIYPIAYRVTPWRQQYVPRRADVSMPLVGLLYVTCNDFSEEALSISMQQGYPNCQTFILDDSYKPGYREQVDSYAQAREIPVIRRADRQGFKGGNLNNFLDTEDGRRLEYFVIVDSDEVLPPEFVTRALDYFAADPSVGILQANHIATRNRTKFMRTFAPGVDAHWPAYQLVKARAGFLSFLGHGAMISRDAYLAGGGFPEIVAEDIGFSLDLLRVGLRVEFAMDIVCEEEFPPDYAAFKKRHRKWTEGNMEFMRKYTRRIFFAREFKWYERLDIILFTYSLPLTGIFSLYVLVNAILFPSLGFSIRFPLWMLIPTVISLVAPMLNDVLTWSGAPKRKLLSYLAHSVILFGSMYFTSLFTSLRTMFRSSVFNVTPKTSQRMSLGSALRLNARELIAGTVLAVIVEAAAGSILPVILLLIPAVFSVYLTVMNDGDTMENPDGRHILKEDK